MSEPWVILQAVLETIFIVYGITESKLFATLRIVVEAAAIRRALLFRGFIYCPFCVGTWVALALGFLHGLERPWLVPVAFVASVAAHRGFFRPPYDVEGPIAKDIAELDELKGRRQ